MGAHHHTELIVWQLADQLRTRIYPLTNCVPFARDFKLREQTEDAVGSICRNISERFGRHSHPEFARFLEIAVSSLNEVEDCLRDAELKNYLTAGELSGLHRLIKRIRTALASFIRYLHRTPTPPPYGKPPKMKPPRGRPQGRGAPSAPSAPDPDAPNAPQGADEP